MTPSELMPIAAEIERLEAPKARARQAEGQRRGGEVFAGREAFGSTEPEASAPTSTSEVVADAGGTTPDTARRRFGA